jgi:hypothetical protein
MARAWADACEGASRETVFNPSLLHSGIKTHEPRFASTDFARDACRKLRLRSDEDEARLRAIRPRAAGKSSAHAKSLGAFNVRAIR